MTRRDSRLSETTSSDALIDADAESEEDPDVPAPVLTGKIQEIFSHQEEPTGGKSYFVKLHGESHRDCRWRSEEELKKIPSAEAQIRRYLKRFGDNPRPEPYFDPDFKIPERIIGSRVSDTGDDEYLVKWKSLDYEMATWETDVPEDLITALRQRDTPRKRV
jgi:hypothetical protein